MNFYGYRRDNVGKIKANKGTIEITDDLALNNTASFHRKIPSNDGFTFPDLKASYPDNFEVHLVNGIENSINHSRKPPVLKFDHSRVDTISPGINSLSGASTVQNSRPMTSISNKRHFEFLSSQVQSAQKPMHTLIKEEEYEESDRDPSQSNADGNHPMYYQTQPQYLNFQSNNPIAFEEKGFASSNFENCRNQFNSNEM